jgi:hypothetical protein
LGQLVGQRRDASAQAAVVRVYDGKLTPVEVEASDPMALRLPLLPGDRIEWE